MALLSRFWLLILILVFFVLFFIFGLYKWVNYSTLQQYHQAIEQWADLNFWTSLLLYMLGYILAVAVSIPGAVFLTLLGGLLFGVILGTVAVVISATIGASILFLAVNMSWGKWLSERASGWLKKMRHGFQAEAFNYLLVLRLIPIFPFWAVNIVPALLGVPLFTFVTATFLGIIPGSFVYVAIGNGLSEILDAGESPKLDVIFSLPVLAPLLGLAILAILPVFYRRFKARPDE